MSPLVTFPATARRRAMAAIIAVVVVPTWCPAQTAATSAMYLACEYTANNTLYLNSVFSVPPTQIAQANKAFRLYAQSESGNAAVRAVCRSGVDQNQLNQLRQNEKQLIGKQAGFPAQSADVNWRFTPTVPATPTVSPAARIQPSQPATGAAPQAGSASNSMSQVGQNTKANAENAGTGIANDASQTVTNTAAELQQAATKALTGFLGKGRRKNADAPQGAAPENTVAQNSAPAQNFAAPTARTPTATTQPPVVIASAQPPAIPTPASASDGITFISCHVAANGSEYFSEVFPSMERADSNVRFAFWKQVSTQYKTGSIPFGAVSCSRSANEQDGEAAHAAAISSAAQRGIANERIIRTGWSYVGQ